MSVERCSSSTLGEPSQLLVSSRSSCSRGWTLEFTFSGTPRPRAREPDAWEPRAGWSSPDSTRRSSGPATTRPSSSANRLVS